MTPSTHRRTVTAGRLAVILAAGLLTAQCGGAGETEPLSPAQDSAAETPDEATATQAPEEDTATQAPDEDTTTDAPEEDTATGVPEEGTATQAPGEGVEGSAIRIGGGVALRAPDGLDLLPVGAQLGAPPDTAVIDTCVGDPGTDVEGDGICNQTHVLTSLEENPGLDLRAWSEPDTWPCLVEGADPWAEGGVSLDPEPVETGTEQIGDLTAEWTRWEAVCGDGQSFHPEQWWFPEVGALVQNLGGGQMVAETAAGIARDDLTTSVQADRILASDVDESTLRGETTTPNDYGWERAGTTVDLHFTEDTVCFTSGDGNYGEDSVPASCADLVAELEANRAEAKDLGIEDADPLVAAVYAEDGTLIALSPQFRS